MVGPSPHPAAMLGVSVLASTYCQSLDKDEDCGNVPEVRDVIIKYEQRLGVNCYAMGTDEEDTVVLALKALRNIGLVETSASVLHRCYEESSNPMEIRLAAMDTIKTLVCTGEEEHRATLTKVTCQVNVKMFIT